MFPTPFSAVALATGLLLLNSLAAAASQPHVTIQDGRWHIDGRVTLPGTALEGLLPNVRMVNSVFEDARPAADWPAMLPPDFEPAANTARFIAAIPDYKAQGVLAFTISLQGGHPGYEGAHNSAFESDGSLRPEYLQRVRSVIEACAAQDMVVILSCFYQRQHGEGPTHLPRALSGRPAVRNAVRNVASWLRERGYRHVLLEIANEFAHSGFQRWRDGDWLRTPAAQVELIELARSVHPQLLVSTSGMGHGTLPATIAEASDFLLVHFNNTALADYGARIATLRQAHPLKPIVVNEDDKVGSAGAEAAERTLRAGASWGYMGKVVNQAAPFRFGGAADDPEMYARLAELSGRGTRSERDAAVFSAVLTEPADGASFRAGTSIRLVGAVSAPEDNPVRAVRFFANQSELEVRRTPPWVITWTGVQAGAYDLRIEAETRSGRVIGSPKVDVYVTPTAAEIPARRSSGSSRE